MSNLNIFLDVYGDEVCSNVKYTHTKAYPSINSTNGGNIHSEENIRWLTKQFTDKPFLIPNIANETTSNYPLTNTAGAGNGLYISGGLVNVNGWLINLADSINNTSFDKSNNNNIQAIDTQSTQRAMLDLIEGTTANLDNILFDHLKYGADDYEQYWETIAQLAVNEPQKIGTVTVHYNKKLTDAITDSNNNCYDTFTRLQGTVLNSGESVVTLNSDGTCNIIYDVYYGTVDNIVNYEENKIFFTDIFQLTYLHNTDIQSETLCYPSSAKSVDMDMFNDTVTPTLTNNNELLSRRSAPINICDETQFYLKGVDNYVTVNDNNFYYRDNSINLEMSAFDKEYLQNRGLSIVQSNTLYRLFSAAGNTNDIKLMDYGNGRWSVVSPYYYAINTIPDELKLKNANGETIPVGFMTASGALTPTSIFGIVDDKCVIVLEGYGAWLKRMCMQLGVAPSVSGLYLNTLPVQLTEAEQSPYVDTNSQKFSNSAEHTNYWKQYIRNWNTGNYSGISAADAFNTTLYQCITQSNDEPLTIVSFSDVYNRYIAPYINMHIQIAKSALCDYTLAESDSSLMNSHRAGKLLEQNGYVSEDAYVQVEVISNISKSDVETYEQKHRFSYPCDINNDVERIRNYAASAKFEKFIANGPKYRHPLESCTRKDTEDIINRIKRCKINDDSTDDDMITINYRVTSLTFDSTVNDFKNVQKDSNDIIIDIVPTDGSVNVVPSHINNVIINVNTFSPSTDYRSKYCNNNNEEYKSANIVDYNLSLDTHTVVNWDGSYLDTIPGYSFKHSTNAWVVGIPVVIQTYTDAQNHLQGENRNTLDDTYAGISITHKLPCDLTNTDAWFLNFWYQSVRGIQQFELESNISTYVAIINEYLKHRRESFIHFDKLYGENFITLKDYILQQVSAGTDLEFNDAKVVKYSGDYNYGLVPQVNTYTEVAKTLTRIKQEVETTQQVFKESNANLTLAPGEYHCVDELVDTLTITYRDVYNLGDGEVVPETYMLPAVNKISTASVRFKFRRSCSVLLQMKPTYNPDTADVKWLSWNSNYPISYTGEDNVPTINISTPDATETEVIIDFSFTPNNNICTVNVLHNPSVLTLCDVSAIIHSLYNMKTISWEELYQMCQSGMASKLFKVGDSKNLTITIPQDGSDPIEHTIPVTVIGINHDGNNTLTFMANYSGDLGLTSVDPVLSDATVSLHGYASNHRFLAGVRSLTLYFEPGVREHILRKTCSVLSIYGENNGDDISITGVVPDFISRPTLWLPSLSEIGLSADTQELEAVEYSVANNTWQADWYTRPEYEGKCYEYFKRPITDQQMLNRTIVLRSHRMLVKEPSGTDFDETYYNDIRRELYVAASSYNNNESDARFFSVLDSATVAELTPVETTFCFVFG